MLTFQLEFIHLHILNLNMIFFNANHILKSGYKMYDDKYVVCKNVNHGETTYMSLFLLSAVCVHECYVSGCIETEQ